MESQTLINYHPSPRQKRGVADKKGVIPGGIEGKRTEDELEVIQVEK